MKHYYIPFLAAVMLFSFGLQAQELSKEEKKQWSGNLKKMTPESLKKMVDDLEASKKTVVAQENTIEELRSENARLRTEVKDHKAAAEAAAKQAEATPTPAPRKEEEADQKNYAGYEAPTTKGVMFKVQVGAFKSFDITKYFNNHKNFSGEVDSDGTMKYTLGIFTDYWEADKFKKYLRDMGVKGAWVVAYKDGKRVNIKDVLEGAI